MRCKVGILLAAALIVSLTGCTSPETPISAYEALDHLHALQDYIAQTGDTDMYLYFLEDIDSDYLHEFIEDYFYTEDLVHDAYYEGYDEGYEHGLETGYENGWYEATGE